MPLLLHLFYFNFILFVHTGHANFDFHQGSLFTKCCFSFEKGSNGQIHSCSDSHLLIKKSPLTLNVIWKSLVF